MVNGDQFISEYFRKAPYESLLIRISVCFAPLTREQDERIKSEYLVCRQNARAAGRNPTPLYSVPEPLSSRSLHMQSIIEEKHTRLDSHFIEHF